LANIGGATWKTPTKTAAIARNPRIALIIPIV